MTYREELAGYSGAVLGYIHYGYRGAKLGYKYGKYSAKLTRKNNNMAPTPPASTRRKRTHSVSNSRGRSANIERGRKLMRMPSSSRSSSRSTVRYNFKVSRPLPRDDAVALRAPSIRRGRKKGVSFKKVKKVPISRQFVKKVHEALEPGMCKGVYREMNTYNFDFSPNFGNRQMTFRLGSNVNGDQMLFNPQRVLDAASVLYNGKTATDSSKYVITGNYPQQANSFDPHTVKVTVLNSYAKHVIKNNSQRNVMLEIYDCAPKVNMNLNKDGDALTQWNNAMAFENTIQGGSTVNQLINVGNTNPNTLYATPQMSKLFMTKFKVETTSVVLAPGQTYDYIVQGPNKVIYDFAKFWSPSNTSGTEEFFDLQRRFTRNVIFTVKLDVVHGNTPGSGVAGRFGPSTTSGINLGRGLLVESTNYYRIEIPSQTAGSMFIPGVTSGTAQTVSMTETQIRDAYFHKHWNESTTITAQDRVEETTGVDVTPV